MLQSFHRSRKANVGGWTASIGISASAPLVRRQKGHSCRPNQTDSQFRGRDVVHRSRFHPWKMQPSIKSVNFNSFFSLICWFLPYSSVETVVLWMLCAAFTSAVLVMMPRPTPRLWCQPEQCLTWRRTLASILTFSTSVAAFLARLLLNHLLRRWDVRDFELFWLDTKMIADTRWHKVVIAFKSWMFPTFLVQYGLWGCSALLILAPNKSFACFLLNFSIYFCFSLLIYFHSYLIVRVELERSTKKHTLGWFSNFMSCWLAKSLSGPVHCVSKKRHWCSIL